MKEIEDYHSNKEETKNEDSSRFPVVGKLIVEKALEEQIRLMCALSPSKEWSGVLFYTAEGSIEKKDVVIRAKNFFLMDLGTGGYTEFKLGEDPSIARFMVDNNLFDCKSGLIHSHCNFSTFFSGTDTSTLKKEGESMPNFVSLVVNNAGKYVAAVTQKTTTVLKGKAVTSYSLFGESTFNFPEQDFEKTVDSVDIFGLEIEKELAANGLLERYNDLTLKKEIEEEKRKPVVYSGTEYPYSVYPKRRDDDLYQKSLFDDDFGDPDDPYNPYYGLFGPEETEKEEKSVKVLDIPDDYDKLVSNCVQKLLVANSRFSPREGFNIMKNSSFPILSIVNTYSVKANDKRFSERVNSTIEQLKLDCIKEKTTWAYIRDFVEEALETLLDDERELSSNKSWYNKPKSAINKIINIIHNSGYGGKYN